MYERAEDFQALALFLGRIKPSRAGDREEWRLLEELEMQDLIRRYQEAWAFLCRRGITQLLRRRERGVSKEIEGALDAAVAEIQRLATTP